MQVKSFKTSSGVDRTCDGAADVHRDLVPVSAHLYRLAQAWAYAGAQRDQIGSDWIRFLGVLNRIQGDYTAQNELQLQHGILKAKLLL